MKRIKDDFEDILKKQRIRPVFQPIVSLMDGNVIGYEALSRIIDPKEIGSSEELFTLAGIYGKVWELEQLCRIRILEKYHSFGGKDNKKLFINVNPMVIHDKNFHAGFTKETLSKYDINLSDVVYEVTERNAIDDVKGFKDTIRHYKNQGYTIAVDDAGSCYSGLNLICDIAPHFLKLDLTLIRGIHEDSVKKAMVKSLVEFTNLTESQLIAEGIETVEELETLLKLGVHNGQGYFLCRPNEALKPVEQEALEIIQKYQQKKQKKMMKNRDADLEYRAVLFSFDNAKAFYAYCEKYGDEAGDRITSLKEKVIMQNLEEEDYAVNMGETGVMVVFKKEGYKTKCEKIVTSFKNHLGECYASNDLQNGFIEVPNKHNAMKKYPILSINTERVI